MRQVKKGTTTMWVVIDADGRGFSDPTVHGFWNSEGEAKDWAIKHDRDGALEEARSRNAREEVKEIKALTDEHIWMELVENGWQVANLVIHTTNFVVVDNDGGEAIGPFASKEEAAAYFIKLARQEEWRETIDLIKETGSPFGESPQYMELMELGAPSDLQD